MQDTTKITISIFVGLFFLFISMIILFNFLDGNFPLENKLIVAYLLYSTSIFIGLHGLFFFVNFWMKDNNSARRKFLPKYIEYAYSILISIGLLQIEFSRPNIPDFIEAISGSESQISNEIQVIAQSYVKEKCDGKNHYFPLDYCIKLFALANAGDPKSFVSKNVLHDEEFIQHKVEEKCILNPDFPTCTDWPSPILALSQKLKSYYYFSSEKIYDKKSLHNAFEFAMLLLLPLGIGLRIVKTSLEIFGDL